MVSKSAKYHYRAYGMTSASVKRNEYLLDNMLYSYKYLYELFKEQEYSEKLLEQLKYYMDTMMRHAGNLLFDVPYRIEQGEVEEWKQKYNDMLELNESKEITWLFPFYELRGARKIVLYGAGKVGKSYLSQVEERDDYEVVAWVDQCINKDRNIVGIKDIANHDYDCVLIAISNSRLIENIIEELVAAGVDKTKIIWKKPIRMKNWFMLQSTNKKTEWRI